VIDSSGLVSFRVNSLRVLFDFSLASDEPAGPKTMMDGLLRGWARAQSGDQLTVFGPASLRRITADLGAQLVVARVGIAPRRILQQHLELPLRRLARAVDVVIAPNMTCPLFGVRAPIIGTLHDVRHLRRPQEFSLASRAFRGAVWSASARRLAGVASVSAFSLQEADDLGLPLPALRAVIPNGVDHVPLDLRTHTKRNTVVCVGHRSSKGLHALPSIWSRVQAELGGSCPQLVVTGVPARGRDEVVARFAARGLVDGYRLTGFLPERDFYAAIAEARALLYLSTYEGYGLVPSEATVLGTHSFVYDLAPYRERAAQLSITTVPVDDAAAMGQELIRFLRSHDRRAVALPPPSWADAATAYRSFVERVLRLAPNPPSPLH
jgi:glycosyltransferase involved in cell wall biosynthesis